MFDYIDLIQNLFSSLLRVACGVMLGSFLGIIFGIIRFSLPKSLQKNFFINLLFDGPKYPPPIAWIPFVILFFGIGFLSSIVIVAIAAFPPMFTQVYDSLSRMNERLFLLLQNLELTDTIEFYKISFKAILPEIFTGFQIALAMGWMAVIAAEMVGGQEGLGYSIQLKRMNLDYLGMTIDIFTIGITGYFLNRVVKFFRKLFVPWKAEINE